MDNPQRSTEPRSSHPNPSSPLTSIPSCLLPNPRRPDSTSNNHLQLPRIPDHILNRLLLPARITASTEPQLSRSSCCTHVIQFGEVDPPILDAPAVLARKVDNGALRVEEEEVLGRGDGEGGVGGLRAGGDLTADGVEEVLWAREIGD